MATGLYTHRTRNAGEIVTDVLYNTAHRNQLQNDVPNQAGGLSDDSTEYQTTQDPAPGGIVNQVVSVEEEFQQLRFTLADIKTALNDGVPLAQWYTPVTLAASAMRGRGARVFRNTTQSIPDDTLTACTFNTVRYDTGVTDPTIDPFFVIGAPTRLTATASGLYLIVGFTAWATGAIGTVSIFVRLNGTKIIGSSQWVTNGVQTPQLVVSCQYQLAQNDYVELIAYQNTPGALNVTNPELGWQLLNPNVVVPPPSQFLLDISEIGSGSGVVTSDVGPINCPGVCSAQYADGTVVTLTATPTVGSFVEWDGDVPIGDETDNPLVLTMDQARTITCRFTAFTLSITESGSGSGIVTSDVGGINCPGVCDAQYGVNDVVQLTPTPTMGVFDGWSGDVTPGDEFDDPLIVTMDADKTIDAAFAMTGVMLGFPSGGSAALSGTRFISPSTDALVNATAGNVSVKLPIDIYLETLSVTMTAALAGGHTVDFNFRVGGVDDPAITINLIATDIDGSATDSIFVAADTLITIRAVQVGGGGDNIQSFAIRYRPA